MSLETSYEVLEMLRDDGVQTFRAKEKTTGRGLELHLFLPFGRPENKLLFEKLKALPLDKRRNFLDMGIDGSTPYLVTDPLPGNRGFKGWADELISGPQSAAAGFITGVMSAVPSRDDGVQILQAGQWRTGTPIPDSLITKPPTAAPPPPKAEIHTGDTGDFTRMFKAPDFSAMAPPQETPAPPPAAAPMAAPIAAQPPTPSGGEFTSFFQAQSAPPPAAAPAEPAFGAAAPVGEFTGLFANKPPAAAPPPPASIPQPYSPSPATPIAKAAPEEPAAGEFTRMFQSPTKTGSYAPQAATGQFKPATQPEPSGGQEFTKYFENPLKPAPMGSPQPMIDIPPPPPPSAAGKRGGEFTNVFGAPSNSPASNSPGGSFSFDSPMPQAPPPQGPVFGSMGSATGAFSAQPAWPQQQQAPPSFPSGPSEYTKMMSAPQMGQAPPQSVFNPAPNYAPPQQQAPAKKSNAVLFIAIGVVLLLIIAIVVVLVMRHPATTPAIK